MEHAGKNIYFRDVHIFVNRVKDIITIIKYKLVCDNFYICFKGKAFYLWNSVLFPEQKRLIKYGEKNEKWEQFFFETLDKEFRPRPWLPLKTASIL